MTSNNYAQNYPNPNFSIKTENNVVTVTYKMATYGIGSLFTAMVLLFVLSFLPYLLLSSELFLFIMSVVVPIAVFIVSNYLRGKPESFSISQKEIIVDDEHFALSRITGFYLTAPYSSEVPIAVQTDQSSTLVAAYGSPAFVTGMAATYAVAKGVGTAIQAGQLASNAAMKRLINDYAEKNVAITFSYGQERINLMGGLSEEMAQAAYPQLLKILGAQ